MSITTSIKEQIREAYNMAKSSGGEISFTEIGKPFGLTGKNVKAILPPDAQSSAKRGRKAVVGAKPLSETHRKLGFKVYNYRVDNRHMSLAEAAEIFLIGTGKLADLERGLYDPPLSELIRICKILNISSITMEE